MKVKREKNELSGTTIVVLWVTLNVWVGGVTGRPDGAPNAACSNMAPNHTSSVPSNMTPPYTVEIVDGETTYSPGTPVQGKSNLLAVTKKF